MLAAHIEPHSAAGVAIGLLIIVAVLATYIAYVRLLERREVKELSKRGASLELLLGAVAGSALFGLTMLVLWLTGNVDIVAGAGWRAAGYPLLGALIAAVSEEVIVRGILFRIVEESLGTWIALVISAAFFGALHAFNPGATLVSSIAIMLEAGLLLAAVFVYTRWLWMAIGLHAAWNFTEGGLFGAGVSGTKAQGVLASQFHGPDLLTGGAFGPEASVVAVLVCVTAGAIFLALARRKGRIIQPRWRCAQVAGH
ncbi:MAG TPA: type II CAAX endopeptidase family protein [Steroidobacteraceae bacterium]|nr:type II CAAX endopeptidase family protein [Steroidobacteraceae bacterium]